MKLASLWALKIYTEVLSLNSTFPAEIQCLPEQKFKSVWYGLYLVFPSWYALLYKWGAREGPRGSLLIKVGQWVPGQWWQERSAARRQRTNCVQKCTETTSALASSSVCPVAGALEPLPRPRSGESSKLTVPLRTGSWPDNLQCSITLGLTCTPYTFYETPRLTFNLKWANFVHVPLCPFLVPHGVK